MYRGASLVIATGSSAPVAFTKIDSPGNISVTTNDVGAHSYAPDTEQGGVRLGASQLDLGSIQQRGKQELSSGGVSVRLYTG